MARDWVNLTTGFQSNIAAHERRELEARLEEHRSQFPSPCTGDGFAQDPDVLGRISGETPTDPGDIAEAQTYLGGMTIFGRIKPERMDGPHF